MDEGDGPDAYTAAAVVGAQTAEQPPYAPARVDGRHLLSKSTVASTERWLDTSAVVRPAGRPAANNQADTQPTS
jgi:hypothetical protein